MPGPLRFLLRIMQLKTNSESKTSLEDLKQFNTQVLQMVSMASQVVQYTDKSKLATYAMIVFLRCPQLAINLENFKIIMHVFSLLEVNAFGVSDSKTQLRSGTALYYPSNFIDHSCNPNAAIVYRNRNQFVIATRKIEQNQPIFISYIDQGIEDAFTRRSILGRDYYFQCECDRCNQCKMEQLSHELKTKVLELFKIAEKSEM